ncbi:hypothetical protein JYT20_00640 [Rhodothermus sp. AH-315-K08]|nr:hypothetical protein [Rhodothermus sp. AH-315-K08]
MKSLAPLLLLLTFVAACQPSQAPMTEFQSTMPALESRADSLAFRALEASGGEQAFGSLPYLEFYFGSESSSGVRTGRRHLWDRMSGDYRLEYNRGRDTTIVVLFNTQSRAGTAFRNGVEADDSAMLVERAYGAFINDTYWLLMPTKMLDPGVFRELVPDSSTTELEVVKLTFEEVGLTPGDSYYIYLDRQTGMVKRWHYVLQSGREGRWDWADYVEMEGPYGPVRLSGRKVGQRSALLTDEIAVPKAVPEDAFTSPSARLPLEV